MMVQQIPYWMQVLQALAVPAIALLAAVIGVMQWRTAHQRAVLDLFEKRFAVWDRLRIVIGDVVREGTANTEICIEFLRAKDGGEFLFGPEVTEYLDRVYKYLVRLNYLRQTMKNPRSDENHAKAVDEEARIFTKVAAFYGDGTRLVMPYMRMHQKAPWV
jgi:hypothetical protein